MNCAECGSKMERHDHGAWVICCNGWGYWYDRQPTDEDIRNYGYPSSISISNWREDNLPFDLPTFWLYKTVKWPRTLKAAIPKLEN